MKYIHTSRSILASACLIVLLSSCSGSRTPVATNLAVPTNGFSGMANIDSKNFLTVHDELSFENGNRISVIQTTKDKNIDVLPVQVADWKHKDGQSSDLEAVCRLPGRNGEFLLVEAGHWEGKFGRMFHIKIDLSNKPYRATVLGVFDLPEFDAKGPLPSP